MRNILLSGISKGLGLEIARILIENKKCKVYGISRSITPELIQLKEDYPERLELINFDLKNISKIKSEIFFNLLHKKILHGYINNAAIAYDDLITNLSIEPLEAMFQVNVFSPMFFTKYVLRNFLLNKQKGAIVHISSISVHTGYKGLAMYAATKGALEAFSKNTAREWGEKGIRSNCIVAGFMDTKMTEKLTEEQKARIYNRNSLKEQTSIESVAETAYFLISDGSASITGQNIFVDSGTI